jgi:hypothetical protein
MWRYTGKVVVFSRIYNRISKAVFGSYIYLQFRFRVQKEFRSLSRDHTNPHQVAIALENAAESNLIGLKPTVDSTVRRQFEQRRPISYPTLGRYSCSDHVFSTG